RYDEAIHTRGVDAGSDQATDCRCDAGYMCQIDGIPCHTRLRNQIQAWSLRACGTPFVGVPNNAPEQATWASATSVPTCALVTNITTSTPCLTGGAGGNCTCGAGFEADDARGVCEDVDECAAGTHSCDEEAGVACDNLVGGDPGYRCGCGAGWTNATEGCADVDECADATHACHLDAACNNSLGSYACACERGFTGDGMVDCWDGTGASSASLFSCVGTMVVELRTSNGSNCHVLAPDEDARDGEYLVASRREYYCDEQAGTADDVLVRFFWLETQRWSEEVSLSAAGIDLSFGALSTVVVSGLSYAGTPTKVHLRLAGSDGWHPESLRVRRYNHAVWIDALSPLCWLDGDNCKGGICAVEDAPCGVIGASATIRMDLCGSEAQPCDQDSNPTYKGTGAGLTGSGTTACPDAAGLSVTSGEASTSVQACFCRAGYFGNITGPGTPCGDGDTCTDGAYCEECPEGEYCAGGRVSVECPGGSWFSSPTGASTCSPFFSPTGASTRSQCALDSATLLEDCRCVAGYAAPALQACAVCQPGTYSPGREDACRDCPAGNFSNGTGAVECETCPEHSASERGSALCTCSDGWVDDEDGGCMNDDECNADSENSSHTCHASANCTDTQGSFTCECTPGFVGNGTACSPCAPGFACPGGNASTACEADAYSAPTGERCAACPKNSSSGVRSGNASACVCAPGFEGEILNEASNCTDVDE
ncbi:hypothetical protein T484DRAFT_1765703, partial [Baffinella frigidus]